MNKRSLQQVHPQASYYSPPVLNELHPAQPVQPSPHYMAPAAYTYNRPMAYSPYPNINPFYSRPQMRPGPTNPPMLGNGGNPMESTSRTIYIGNLSPHITLQTLCSLLKGGLIERIRYIPDKACVFVAFVDRFGAILCMEELNRVYPTGLPIGQNTPAKVGWAKSSIYPIPPDEVRRIAAGATRALYLGNLPPSISFEQLCSDFGYNETATLATFPTGPEQIGVPQFGPIELIRLIPEKKCAFISFVSLNDASRALELIHQGFLTAKNPNYVKVKVGYGKDRCDRPTSSNEKSENLPDAYPPREYIPPVMAPIPRQYMLPTIKGMPSMAAQVVRPMSFAPRPIGMGVQDTKTILTTPFHPTPFDQLHLPALRALYFGDLAPGTLATHFCDVVRSYRELFRVDVLEQDNKIKTRCAFMTFVDPESAKLVWALSNATAQDGISGEGLIINGKKVRVGWGKEVGMSRSVLEALKRGASRSLILQNLDLVPEDEAATAQQQLSTESNEWNVPITSTQLYVDFGIYGLIESIQPLPDQHACIINYCHLMDAARVGCAIATGMVPDKTKEGQQPIHLQLESLYPEPSVSDADTLAVQNLVKSIVQSSQELLQSEDFVNDVSGLPQAEDDSPPEVPSEEYSEQVGPVEEDSAVPPLKKQRPNEESDSKDTPTPEPFIPEIAPRTSFVEMNAYAVVMQARYSKYNIKFVIDRVARAPTTPGLWRPDHM